MMISLLAGMIIVAFFDHQLRIFELLIWREYRFGFSLFLIGHFFSEIGNCKLFFLPRLLDHYKTSVNAFIV